ncbi:MAG: CPBP family intramembrane glutamic endopeptidase [Candidatus Aenigmatarchaeota archaeon]
MDFINFYINRWLIPAFLSLAFFLILKYKQHIISRTKSIPYLSLLIKRLRADVDDWKATIAAPALAAIALNFLLWFVFQQKPASYDEPLWFAALTSGFLNPIAETFLVQGILLSALFLLSEHMPIKLHSKIVSIVFVAAIFALLHTNLDMFQFTARFSAALLFNTLYAINRQNLLPPIIAHAGYNWTILALEIISI